MLFRFTSFWPFASILTPAREREWNSMNILLVDDEEIVHETIGDYLRESGIQVESVYDGLAALEVVEA